MSQNPSQNSSSNRQIVSIEGSPDPLPRPSTSLPSVENPNRPSSNSPASSILKIVIGTEKKEYTINKALICSESAFFRSACKDEATDCLQTTTITLPEYKAKILRLFIDWILIKSVSATNSTIEIPPASLADDEGVVRARPQSTTSRYAELCDLVLDSQMVECEEFEDAIEAAMVKFCKNVFLIEFDIPEGTPLDKIIRICKYTENGPIRIFEPGLSYKQAEEWMQNNGYIMLRDSQEQFCKKLVTTSVLIRISKARRCQRKGKGFRFPKIGENSRIATSDRLEDALDEDEEEDVDDFFNRF